MRVYFPALLLCILSLSTLAADKPQTFDVWPGKAPGEKGDIGPEKLMPPGKDKRPVERLANVTRPTLTVYQPPEGTRTGTAVLVCPGGGYHILAMDLEGTEVAQWLNSIGVTAIVLKYRVPRREGQPKHQAPLQDAQRAMSIVRSNAAEWAYNPKRIGILGFSAGGHLSAAVSTNHDQRTYKPIDEIDKTSNRPDFTVLLYPGYLVADEGKSPEKGLAPEIRVSKDTPPMFLAHAQDDPILPENSIQMFLALKRAKVPAELHIYSSGGHGFGLRKSEHACSTWPARCEEWLKAQGMLK
jgi:acetyl esterase/lipase